MKGPFARVLVLWIPWAISSLPVPVSPIDQHARIPLGDDCSQLDLAPEIGIAADYVGEGVRCSEPGYPNHVLQEFATTGQRQNGTDSVVVLSQVPSRFLLELTGASSGDMRLSDHAARSMI